MLPAYDESPVRNTHRLEEQRRTDLSILDEIGEVFKDVPRELKEREVTRRLAAAWKK